MAKLESRAEVLNYIETAKKEADALIILLQKNKRRTKGQSSQQPP